MSPLEVAAIISAIAGPISGIVVAIIVNKRTRAKDKKDTEVAADANEVALRAVEVDEKQAHNQEISIIIEGFTASMATLRTEFSDTRLQLQETRLQLDESRAMQAETQAELRETREEVARLRERIEEKDEREAEMKSMLEEAKAHILALEVLIPSPPGPPTRPGWIVPAVGL